MEIPAVTRERILVRLRDELYQVIPLKYQTYCVLTAQICSRVLRHFRVDASVVPCQLWWVGPDTNFVVGFYRKASEAQWEGHVVCMSDDFLIDAALYHIQKQLNVEVPKVVLARTFALTSNVISRLNLPHGTQLWWHRPPPELDIVIPVEPEELIVRYTDELVARLRSSFADELRGKLAPSDWQSMQEY